MPVAATLARRQRGDEGRATTVGLWACRVFYLAGIVFIAVACGGSASSAETPTPVPAVQTATAVSTATFATPTMVLAATPTPELVARPASDWPSRNSCSVEISIEERAANLASTPNLVQVGGVTFNFGPDGPNDARATFSSGNGLFGTKFPIQDVSSGPGAVITLSGSDIDTGAPIYFQFKGEPLDEMSRGSTTFTVPKPIGTNPPGFAPGFVAIEALGMYELHVEVDGVDQGTLVIAFCRSGFYGPGGRPS